MASTSTLMPNVLTLSYNLISDYQGKGIGTVMLDELVKQVYEEKEFNKEFFKSGKTSIKRIELDILDDNEASKKIAIKNGFKKLCDREFSSIFSLTLEDYLKQRQDRDRTN